MQPCGSAGGSVLRRLRAPMRRRSRIQARDQVVAECRGQCLGIAFLHLDQVDHAGAGRLRLDEGGERIGLGAQALGHGLLIAQRRLDPRPAFVGLARPLAQRRRLGLGLIGCRLGRCHALLQPGEIELLTPPGALLAAGGELAPARPEMRALGQPKRRVGRLGRSARFGERRLRRRQRLLAADLGPVAKLRQGRLDLLPGRVQRVATLLDLAPARGQLAALRLDLG